MPIEIERMGFGLGARVTGIDLRHRLDASAVREIRTAWLEHLVLYFPGQDLTPEQLIEFTGTFGTVDDNRQSKFAQHPAYPEIMVVSNKPRSGKPWTGYRFGEQWHSDLATTVYPTSASLLLCKERPKTGGDTMFANQYMAYESLSHGVQRFVDGLETIHDNLMVKGAARRSAAELAELRRLQPACVQPAVRTHPETGRKALYVSERVYRFKDWTLEESLPLLTHLTRHAVQEEFCYRHRWTVGDIAVWDNRCVMHKALGDFDMWNQPREMLRTSVLGETSGYLFDGDAVEGSPLKSHEVSR